MSKDDNADNDYVVGQINFSPIDFKPIEWSSQNYNIGGVSDNVTLSKEDFKKILNTMKKSISYLGYKEYEIGGFNDSPTDYNDELIEAIALLEKASK